MLRLLIDGKPVIVKEGTQFKLTRENAIYTDAGDYTLDVTLPLAGCLENLQVFGSLHRMEVGKARAVLHTYSFSLMADDVSTQGTAILTSINQEEVKLQLLAGRSGLNFAGTEIFIDELDLGVAWEELFLRFKERHPGLNTSVAAFGTMFNAIRDLGTNLETVTSGSSEETDFVAFPIWSETDEEEANAHQVVLYDESKEDWIFALKDGSHYADGFPRTSIKSYTLAPQPYMAYVVERILKALGFTLLPEDNAMRDGWMKDIFIANSRSTIHLARMLPHWKVSEFLKEVQQFYGIVFICSGKAVRAVKRNGSNTQVVYLNEVVDEYSVELDEDEQKEDISNVNVGFAYPDDDNFAILPEVVWDHADVVSRDEFDAASESDRGKLLVHNIYNPLSVYSVGYWAYLTDETMASRKVLCPVNSNAPHQVRPESREADMELKIVPTRVQIWRSKDGVRYYKYDRFLDYVLQKKGNIYQYLQMVTSDKLSSTGYEDYSIEDYLLEKDETDEKRDVIEVALRLPSRTLNPAVFEGTDGKSHLLSVPSVEGAPFIRYHDGGFAGSRDWRFNISPGCDWPEGEESPRDFLNTVINGVGHVRSKAKWVISFLDRVPIDVTATFVIRGRRFSCEKIEYQVSDQGLEPVKKGYFYELEG